MTEAELLAHRKQQDAAEADAAEREKDKLAWTRRDTAAIEMVDRGSLSSDRELLRQRVAEMVALRLTGHTLKEIAVHMNCTADTVRRWLAHAEELAEQNNVGALLDYHAVPLAVDNLIAGLENGNEKYTLKVLEGRGWFQKHTKGTTAVQQKGSFVFSWQNAPAVMPEIPDGAIIGTPRLERVTGVEVMDDEEKDK